MVFRLILPDWAYSPGKRKVLEGEFSEEQLKANNEDGYNVYWLPNYPSHYEKGTIVQGSHIDTFRYVFVDMDLKQKDYESKEQFLQVLEASTLKPSFIVDSGNGIHAYWEVSDLDALSYLKLQRRLCRHFVTDETVAKIYQLMRYPVSLNTKDQNNFKQCSILHSDPDKFYACEDLDQFLPPISKEDLDYCIEHHTKTYMPDAQRLSVDEKLPPKFGMLLSTSQEAKDIWTCNTDDRSRSDYRLGHLMFANGFTRDEALSVLVNSQKALSRAPIHRVNYASGIVDKIWTYEVEETLDHLSNSVKDILERSGDVLKGTRFACHRVIDATAHGFRLGQVIGLVAGSGVGKTAMALNLFKWFTELNPDYVHFFIPLEQPENEIADRWRTMCGTDTRLHDKVHIISNYNRDGSFRHLSLHEIEEYIVSFQARTGKKAGCVVIDHIGALKKKGAEGENQGLMDICHAMKSFAIRTNTMLVMQSQAPREKAGIGDLELNKDAAYGTVYFESYCDYLITIWQPLKRCNSEEGCPSVTAFKFCKIRHKKLKLDEIQEDVPYRLYFDSTTEHMRQMTQDEEISFDYWNKMSLNKRKADRKTDLVVYKSTEWVNESEPNNDNNSS